MISWGDRPLRFRNVNNFKCLLFTTQPHENGLVKCSFLCPTCTSNWKYQWKAQQRKGRTQPCGGGQKEQFPQTPRKNSEQPSTRLPSGYLQTLERRSLGFKGKSFHYSRAWSGQLCHWRDSGSVLKDVEDLCRLQSGSRISKDRGLVLWCSVK